MKNKAERNKDYTTVAKEIFQGKDILIARPDNMPMEDYKILRKMQSTILKRILR